MEGNETLLNLFIPITRPCVSCFWFAWPPESHLPAFYARGRVIGKRYKVNYLIKFDWYPCSFSKSALWCYAHVSASLCVVMLVKLKKLGQIWFQANDTTIKNEVRDQVQICPGCVEFLHQQGLELNLSRCSWPSLKKLGYFYNSQRSKCFRSSSRASKSFLDQYNGPRWDHSYRYLKYPIVS